MVILTSKHSSDKRFSMAVQGNHFFESFSNEISRIWDFPKS
jgi:hypothetical protein